MITGEQLEEVVGATAFDRSGDKIGKVGNVYYDDAVDQPMWLTVHTGLFGMSETFVPLNGADFAADGRLTVAYDKAAVKDAPNVDADGHLSPDEEQQLYRYYNLDGGTSDDSGSAGGGSVGGEHTTTDTAPQDTTPAAGTPVDPAGQTDTVDRTYGRAFDGHHTPREDQRMGTATSETERPRLRKRAVTEQASGVAVTRGGHDRSRADYDR